MRSNCFLHVLFLICNPFPECRVHPGMESQVIIRRRLLDAAGLPPTTIFHSCFLHSGFDKRRMTNMIR